jgi:membrane protein DedA with SNARE-associated domain
MFETIPFIEHFPYLGLFTLLILGTLGLPFPEDGILLLSGFLTAHYVIRPFPAFLVVYSGLLITDFLLYSVGKKYGRGLVEHKKFQKIITNDRLAKLEEKFKKWGALVVFFGRHLLGLRAQIFLVAGVMRMSWKKFLIVDGTSALLTITLWGGLGYLGGNSIQTLKRDITNIKQIVMVILAILVAGLLLFRHLKKRRNRFGRHHTVCSMEAKEKMVHQSTKFFNATIALILFFWPSAGFAEWETLNGVAYELFRDGNLYTFRGSFLTFSDPDCLLDILYDFDHLRKFVTCPNSFSLLQKGDNWHSFCCTYRVLLSENKLIYRKTLKKEELRVTFEMIAGRQNIKLIPEVLSSSGYYEIMPKKDGYQVVYFHQDRLSPSFCRDIYLYLAKKEAVKFLQELKNYVEKECY